MNKTAIKNFAIWARNKLIADIGYRAGLMGITPGGIRNALPQSAGGTEFYDIGTSEPYSISGAAVKQRRHLVQLIRVKEKETDYKTAFKYVIEEAAYTWFNRLIAVRFMEVNDYLPSHIRVLSSESGKIEPDLVTMPFDAGLPFSRDEEEAVYKLKQENKLDEVFRLLFIKQCNALNEILPFLFEKTSDYTELLLNLSVADQDGVVCRLVRDIPEEDFDVNKGGQVEIIGWLYQYYNTEPKDKVFADLKKNIKITKEKIPAATQLFTSDWIVHYMAENSLGRLWLEGHPSDALKAEWKYYLEEAKQEPEVEKQLAEIRKGYAALKPEEIRVIDPCCGSGHILCVLFDMLVRIYESCGYTARDAALKITENNIWGLDIDERAAQLSYFAVMMKARQYDRRFFSRKVQPHVYAIHETNAIRETYVHAVENVSLPKIHRKTLDYLIDAFIDAKEYGSLIQPESRDYAGLKEAWEQAVSQTAGDAGANLWYATVASEITHLIGQAAALSQKYDAVVTNPPYMGSGGMNVKLSEFVKENYPDSKSDLFAVFIERCGDMTAQNGFQAMITQHSWMFLSSFEKLRAKLQNIDTVNMVHLGARAFEEIGGEVVQTVSFVIRNTRISAYLGTYCRLIEPTTQQGKEDMFLEGENRYTAKQDNFAKIPGAPVAYWASDKMLDAFKIGHVFEGSTKKGVLTGDNAKFMRLWHEIDLNKMGLGLHSHNEMLFSKKKWFPVTSGGLKRKWYGNFDTVVNLENDGEEIKATVQNYRLRDPRYYMREAVTWTEVSSGLFTCRYVPEGILFGNGGPVSFFDNSLKYYLGLLNSKTTMSFMEYLAPTINYGPEQINKIPLIKENISEVDSLADACISISEEDWDSFETSWDFKEHPFIASARMSAKSGRGVTLKRAFEDWQAAAEDRFRRLKENEEELNRIFIDIYGLQDELTPDVAERDVTVHCIYDSRDDVPEAMRGSNYVRTMRDEIVSFISYAVGCMFGRYSLDVPGLAYAGGRWDASKYTTFLPDADNVIPITDEEYLEDDVVSRFCTWLKAAFGDKALSENLDFIAKALGGRGSSSREILRNYFLNDFFKDHCQTYSVTGSGKRPIYWLFDSGRQNGFKALIYLHRYNADTIGNLRVDYLHRMQRVYESEIRRMQDMTENSMNVREAAQAAKRLEKLQKQLKECREYDEKLAHLALSRIELDLDDGVKVNYRKVQTAVDGKFYEVLADSNNIMAKK